MSGDAPADDGVTLPPQRSDRTEPGARAEGGAPAGLPPSTVMPRDPTASNALPPGALLHEYTVERTIGEGGFGIVYLARDNQLQRTVAIKEYMPAQLACRQPDLTVSVRSRRHAETFALGLRSFVNEARLLALFDHPSLVKVYRFWEANGTAYMVMPYYRGPTLKEWLLNREDRPPDEAWLKRLLRPLLDALEIIHADHCYHRDIAPDNILLLGEDHPLLLDFGAARRVIGDATQALTVFLKPGYAPIEQYAEVPSMKQGPWTDVYALCAVVYAAMLGYSPPPSVGRMIKDEVEPVERVAAGRYSPAFLRAVDAGLAVKPSDRPQDIAALRALFFPELAATAAAAAAQRTVGPDWPPAGQSLAGGSPTTAPAPVTSITLPREIVPSPPAAPVPAPMPAPAPATGPDGTRRGVVSALLAVGALGLVGLGAWWLVTRPAEVPQADGGTGVMAQASVPAAAPASASQLAPAPAPAPMALLQAVREPFSIVGALEQIVRQADPLFAVNTLPDKSPVVVGRDRLQFRVKSSEPGYLYVYLAGTDAAHFWLLFPNQVDARNRIEADRETVLPREGWQLDAGGPPGVNHIVTVVTRHPMDLSALDLRVDGYIREFDRARAEQRWQAHRGPASPFLGPPVCPPGAGACEQRYGAALLRIEEIDPPAPR